MSCTEYQTSLSELADGSLAAEARSRVEAHVATCDACRSALADIKQIRQAARGLPKVEPPGALWNAVLARIEGNAAPQKVTPITAGRKPRFAFSPSAWGLAAAAAIVILALSAGVVFVQRNSSPAPDSQAATTPAATPAASGTSSAGPANATAGDLVQSVEMELQLADQHYERAIAGLEQVAREGQGTLDTATASVLQKNLGVIDQAIHESRSALQAEPASDTARTSLFEALRRKVELLQDAVALINEMRKGNSVGAAEIVESRG